MVTILIKSFNRSYYLDRCLQSIARHVKGDYQIIVLDDGTPKKYLSRLTEKHPHITIKDFSFYDIEIFNRCASSDELLMAIGKWDNIHPLVKVIPVSWKHTIPFGLLHSPKPTVKVQKLLAAINRSPLSEISTR